MEEHKTWIAYIGMEYSTGLSLQKGMEWTYSKNKYSQTCINGTLNIPVLYKIVMEEHKTWIAYIGMEYSTGLSLQKGMEWTYSKNKYSQTCINGTLNIPVLYKIVMEEHKTWIAYIGMEYSTGLSLQKGMEWTYSKNKYSQICINGTLNIPESCIKRSLISPNVGNLC